MSVLLFHPSVGPCIQQAARALHEAGQLARFVTTIRDAPGSGLQRAACAAARMFGRNLEARFRRRAVTEVPDELVEAHPWGEFLRLAVAGVDPDGRMTDAVWEIAETGFDRGIARRLDSRLTGVYGFEHSSLATFRRARGLGLRIAYDLPAPEARFVMTLIEGELDRFPELRTPYHRHTEKLHDRRIRRRHDEWRLADVAITASRFTRDSYAAAGLDVSKARVIPVGAPPVTWRPARAVESGGVTFVFAGAFSVHKGAHYLIDAWRKCGFGKRARLLVFGKSKLPPRACMPPPDGVEFRGHVPRQELLDEMRRADALVFPTLCDGFGMVVTEAWSCGLPVIATERAGAAEQLVHGRNGLLIRAGDADSIREALEWCLANRSQLHDMRTASAETAAGWQWPDYRRALASALGDAGMFQPR